MFMPGGVPRGHGSVVAHFTPARCSVCSSSATGTGRERESKDAQLQERPFAAGQHAHGHPVGCGVPVELSPIEELMEGTRCCRRPRDHPTRGRARQSLVGSGVSSLEALGVGSLANGRDVHHGQAPIGLQGRM